MIQAIELTKTYSDGTLALDRLDLAIAPGEIYCLLGANGAGKTTAINLFLDFLAPSSGRALIAGIEVFKDPLQAKSHVGYLSENVMLYSSFTALQNLRFFAQLAAKDPGDEVLCRTLVEVGLPAEALNRRVGEFSKGMRQKVGIAITLVKDAGALFLDEPTSGLDPKATAEFLALLTRLRAQGKAILMSTHDLFHAGEVADRAGIMRRGKKVAELESEELNHRDLRALYLELMRDTGEAT
jgi:ABC-2 type transport system ATP-binding protein